MFTFYHLPLSTFPRVPSQSFQTNVLLPASPFPEKAKIWRWRSGKRNDGEAMRKTKSLKRTDCSVGARLHCADQTASQQLTMCLSLVGVKFSVEGGWNKVSFWHISVWLASVSCIYLGKQLLANVNGCTPTAWKLLLYPPASRPCLPLFGGHCSQWRGLERLWWLWPLFGQERSLVGAEVDLFSRRGQFLCSLKK